MWSRLLLLWVVLVGGVMPARCEPYLIEVLTTAYGDGQGHTCTPDISICNGLAKCSFLVEDSLCSLGSDAGSARNLEVIFSCGVPLQDKGVAAAKGTRITLDCQPH